MPSIIIVDKTGSVKSTNVKTLEISELYKKCGFKTADGFSLHHTWSVEFNGVEYKLQVYGKTDGKANSENKYEFPPPIDKTLFFGSCVILNIENGVVSNMTAHEFNDIMEYLQGGYSDIGDSDEEEDISEEDIGPTTKQGYQKDGFVVDDECESDDVSSSSEEPIKKKKYQKAVQSKSVFAIAEKYTSELLSEKPNICIKKPTKPRAKKEKVVEPVSVYCSENVTCELVEEEYLESI
jgi:hypothetical protein